MIKRTLFTHSPISVRAASVHFATASLKLFVRIRPRAKGLSRSRSAINLSSSCTEEGSGGSSEFLGGGESSWLKRSVRNVVTSSEVNEAAISNVRDCKCSGNWENALSIDKGIEGDDEVGSSVKPSSIIGSTDGSSELRLDARPLFLRFGFTGSCFRSL